MINEYTLEVREDNASGELGLMVAGTPMLSDEPMVALSGMLIAHDLIEHVNGHESIGSIDDELEALGACWNTRGQFGDFGNQFYSPEEILASEVMNLARIFVVNQVDFRNDTPETGEREDFDEFTTIIEIAREMLDSELGDELIRPEDFKERADVYFNDAIEFMIQGYNKSVELYGGQAWSHTLFHNIEEVVEPCIKEIEYEGQTFKLTVNMESGEASCKQFYDDDDYYDEVI